MKKNLGLTSPSNHKISCFDTLSQKLKTLFGNDHSFERMKLRRLVAHVPIRIMKPLSHILIKLLKVKRHTMERSPRILQASGATSGTKYIPISRESMPCHLKGAKDLAELIKGQKTPPLSVVKPSLFRAATARRHQQHTRSPLRHRGSPFTLVSKAKQPS